MPLNGAEVADLDAIIAGLERERCAMDTHERAADQALIDEGIESGRAAWRYIDPEVETLRTITDVPWFYIE